ncbi:structural maintenance of chromosomes protein 5-like [Zophobas morio]|uniref:structural maintenance of chromosomes protein 5-like n=1 Tax=Zophobas morio TaxID=2755281 RepID=UPI003082C88B
MKNLKEEESKYIQKLKTVDDHESRLLNVLKEHNIHAYKATMWLRDHASIFEKRVFAPILTQLHVLDIKFAEFIEASISNHHKFSFIVQTKSDMLLLKQKCKDEQNLLINILLAPPENVEYPTPLTREQMKQYGLHHYISELYNAPAPVKRALNEYASHYRIAIGDTKCQKFGEQLYEKSVRNYFSEGVFFQNKRSIYGDCGLITTTHLIPKAKYLQRGVDQEYRKSLEKSLKEIQENIEIKSRLLDDNTKLLGDLRRQIDEKNNEKEELKCFYNTLQKLRANLNLKQSTLESLKKTIWDYHKEKKIVDQKVQECNEKRAAEAIAMKNYVLSASNMSEKAIHTAIELVSLQARKVAIEQKTKDLTNALNNLENTYQNISKRLQELREHARKLLKDALEQCDCQDETFTSAFSLLPNSLEEINDLLAQKEAVISCSGGIEPRLLEEYEQRQKEIHTRKSALAQSLDSYATLSNEIGALKVTWLTPLNEMLKEVNEKFSTFFRSIGCAGEVLLTEHNDFSMYGLDIRVKFRACDSLSVLDHHRQSGGERSVSTMLYLMAMQGLNTCPFRVVDEINQGTFFSEKVYSSAPPYINQSAKGMDPVNERRVFSIISAVASQSGTSQYFLITPKLLPSLTFTENTSILCVFNGNTIMNQKNWLEQSLADFFINIYFNWCFCGPQHQTKLVALPHGLREEGGCKRCLRDLSCSWAGSLSENEQKKVYEFLIKFRLAY